MKQVGLDIKEVRGGGKASLNEGSTIRVGPTTTTPEIATAPPTTPTAPHAPEIATAPPTTPTAPHAEAPPAAPETGLLAADEGLAAAPAAPHEAETAAQSAAEAAGLTAEATADEARETETAAAARLAGAAAAQDSDSDSGSGDNPAGGPLREDRFLSRDAFLLALKRRVSEQAEQRNIRNPQGPYSLNGMTPENLLAFWTGCGLSHDDASEQVALRETYRAEGRGHDFYAPTMASVSPQGPEGEGGGVPRPAEEPAGARSDRGAATPMAKRPTQPASVSPNASGAGDHAHGHAVPPPKKRPRQGVEPAVQGAGAAPGGGTRGPRGDHDHDDVDGGGGGGGGGARTGPRSDGGEAPPPPPRGPPKRPASPPEAPSAGGATEEGSAAKRVALGGGCDGDGGEGLVGGGDVDGGEGLGSDGDVDGGEGLGGGGDVDGGDGLCGDGDGDHMGEGSPQEPAIDRQGTLTHGNGTHRSRVEDEDVDASLVEEFQQELYYGGSDGEDSDATVGECGEAAAVQGAVPGAGAGSAVAAALEGAAPTATAATATATATATANQAAAAHQAAVEAHTVLVATVTEAGEEMARLIALKPLDLAVWRESADFAAFTAANSKYEEAKGKLPGAARQCRILSAAAARATEAAAATATATVAATATAAAAVAAAGDAAVVAAPAAARAPVAVAAVAALDAPKARRAAAREARGGEAAAAAAATAVAAAPAAAAAAAAEAAQADEEVTQAVTDGAQAGLDALARAHGVVPRMPENPLFCYNRAVAGSRRARAIATIAPPSP